VVVVVFWWVVGFVCFFWFCFWGLVVLFFWNRFSSFTLRSPVGVALRPVSALFSLAVIGENDQDS